MKISKIWLVPFSPTGSSRKVITAIAAAMTGIPSEECDLTYAAGVGRRRFGPDELVIIGVPVYAGRVAPLAVERLQTLQGDRTPAVIVATYGNRDFEDALVELRDIARQASFVPLAAGAFIGEHSFSGAETPIAAGRPDGPDLAIAEAFGARIGARLAALETLDAACCPDLPGNVPYREGPPPLPLTPALVEAACTKCGICLTVCPNEAITLQEKIAIDVERCIFCCACIKSCPEEALVIDAAPVRQVRQWLHEHCTERREPQLYL
jgi:ferredoxin